MKRYEAETDEIATWNWHDKEFVTDDYIAWLEAKAEAYDRLISMNIGDKIRFKSTGEIEKISTISHGGRFINGVDSNDVELIKEAK